MDNILTIMMTMDLTLDSKQNLVGQSGKPRFN